MPEPGSPSQPQKIERIEAPRGTQDLLPEDAERWQATENRIRGWMARFGFREIRTPVFEHAEVYRRPLGSGSDIVAKEMYEFDDKGGRRLALRAEGTAPVVRAFIEHSLHQKGGRHKLFYLCPVFRYDRPQKGRYREHHQVGVEAFGSPSASQDAEVMALGSELLHDLGVGTFERRVNAGGCPACRPGYLAALRAFLEPLRDRLCEDCRGPRMEHNVMRVLDCKVDGCRRETAAAPAPMDHLCADCRAHHDGLLGHLRTLGVDVLEDRRLVRGFDYYTRTVFEYMPRDAGQQGTLLGGGRYDGLVELLGGPATPAVGWGMGLERVLAAAPAPAPARGGGVQAYVLATSSDAFPRAFALVHALRRAGVACELGQEGKSLNSQLRSSGSSGAAWAVFVGPGAGPVGLKNLATHAQEDLAEADLVKRLIG